MKTIIWLNWIKIIATFAVVLLHVNSSTLLRYDDFGLIYWFSNLVNSSTRWAVPMFIMASGTTLLYQNKLFPLKDYYKKRFIKLITPLLFWSLIYILFYQIIQPYGESPLISEQLFNTLVKGRPAVHLWFLFMLFGLYLFAPFIFYLLDSALKNEMKLFLAISFLLSFLVAIKDRFWGNNLQLWITSFLYFVPYFITGRYIYNTRMWKRYSFKKILSALIIIYCVNILGTYILQNYFSGNYGLFLNSDLSLTIVALSISLYLLSPKISLFKKKYKVIQSLSTTLFGVYIIHPLIIYGYYKIGISSSTFNPILAIPTVSILVYFTSVCIVLGLKKIPILKLFV